VGDHRAHGLGPAADGRRSRAGRRLHDIPVILSLGHEGHIKLTELITKKYTLDEINEGYQDLMDGKNIRGVIVRQH
jgi:Zn-dependent alcohol dehydrogenase